MAIDSILTASWTVIIGVTVYSLSQIISKFLIEPIHKMDEIRGEIADSLAYYADLYSNPGSGTKQPMRKASNTLRQKATLLRARRHLVRGYPLFSLLKILPQEKNIVTASEDLFGLSNSIFKGNPSQNIQWAEEIKEMLNLK